MGKIEICYTKNSQVNVFLSLLVRCWKCKRMGHKAKDSKSNGGGGNGDGNEGGKRGEVVAEVEVGEQGGKCLLKWEGHGLQFII